MEQKRLFSNSDLLKLLIPLMIEQLLASLMGMVDSVMVSNVGPTAISAVSLVDSINILIIQIFSALAAGGTILCAQYMGKNKVQEANRSAKQLVFVITFIAVILTIFCLAARNPLLRVIFGKVESGVMSDSLVYFFYTALSFPFIALYNAGASIYRAQKNTRLPMTISVISNFINILGNGLLIWGFQMGVKGAAISTLVSRIFCAVMVMAFLRKESNQICLRNYLKIRPEWSLIRKILQIGIPSGIENGMFQFGKLAIQSTVATLGTIAIAAQAMTNILENLNGILAIGIGIGLMTVVGQCIGAGRKEEAIYYVKKLSIWGEVVMILSCLGVFFLVRPITVLGGMEAESARMCIEMVAAITIIKPLAWILSFIPAYGMRAAGDVKFSMITSCITMWLCRVTLCIILCRFFGFGPMGVWIGMFTDWIVRGIVFTLRFHSRKWLNHKII